MRPVCRNFLWPEDLDTIVFLLEKHPETILVGSVADHIYLSPGVPETFKDLDILVGKSFWDMLCDTDKSAKDLMDSGKFDVTNYDEMGIWSPGRTHVLFGETKYPAKFMVSARGVFIDAFISKINPPCRTVEYKGHFLKIMRPEDRLASLDSIISAKAKKDKIKKVVERRQKMYELIKRGH